MNLEELKVIDVSDITSGQSVVVPSKKPDILEDGKIIDVSNIITVRHDPEIWPNKGAMTLRNLCPNSPENKDLLNKLQAIVDANHLVCDESLFEGEFEVISNIEEVKKLLTEVIIRFDTDPDYYSKDDYLVLVALMYRSLLYLYVRGDGVFHVDDKTTAEAISENKADTIYFTTDNKTIVYKGKEYGTVDPEGILAKEATLLAKFAELKEALNTIDFTSIEQAIQNVENITAREATLIQGVGDIIQAVENIDFTDLEKSIADVKNAVINIDFSALAKDETLTEGISSVKSKVEEESRAIQSKIANIKLPEIDTTELAKESTLSQGVTVITDKLEQILNTSQKFTWKQF